MPVKIQPKVNVPNEAMATMWSRVTLANMARDLPSVEREGGGGFFMVVSLGSVIRRSSLVLHAKNT